MFPIALTGRLAADLAALVRRTPQRMHPDAKNTFYRHVTTLLLRELSHIHYCCWDFHDDPDEAVEEYWTWVEGTAADARDEDPEAYVGESMFGFCTLLVLAPRSGRAADVLDRQTDVGEEVDHVTGETLEHLLRLIPTLDYRSVTSDVVMVRPGESGFGVPETLLSEGGYHHLGPVL